MVSSKLSGWTNAFPLRYGAGVPLFSIHERMSPLRDILENCAAVLSLFLVLVVLLWVTP